MRFAFAVAIRLQNPPHGKGIHAMFFDDFESRFFIRKNEFILKHPFRFALSGHEKKVLRFSILGHKKYLLVLDFLNFPALKEGKTSTRLVDALHKSGYTKRVNISSC
jgi:hypothetical protein